MSYDFDTLIDRIGTHCSKWDKMEALYGIAPNEGIPMWVADMDFAAAPPIQDALQGMLDHGVYGYFADDSAYKAAISWWMSHRHGWEVEPEAILSTQGLVNAVSLAVECFTRPEDAVILMTPVYYSFHRVIRAQGRRIQECELSLVDGRYEMDFDAWDAALKGDETMLVLCSPHNPGGRVWTRAELEGVADFARRHDLVLVSDEIHQDLVFPGAQHVPMATLDNIRDRLVMLTAASKTFNIAGADLGNVIIHDPALRETFAKRQSALALTPNRFGLFMVQAAYSPEGAAWVDALVAYLDENRKLLDAALNAIPGVSSVPLEATYLAWADFSGTGMANEEVRRRVLDEAKIAVNLGPTFGKGGETFLRFNFATPRARVQEAAERLQAAFADLQ